MQRKQKKLKTKQKNLHQKLKVVLDFYLGLAVKEAAHQTNKVMKKMLHREAIH